MPKPKPGPNRHHYRIWLKAIIKSGLVERLPSSYSPTESDRPQHAAAYAHRLMTELRDPEASGRTVQEIVSDARRFKTWVEARRKDDLRRQLVESRPEERIVEMAPIWPIAPATNEQRTRRSERTDPDPKLHPMWDKWIDSMNT